MTLFGFLPYLISLSPPLLVVLGWWVVNRAAQKRDDTKGRRELIIKTADAISEQVNRLMSTAVAYHTNPQRQIAQEIEINSGLKDLSIQLKLLNQADQTIAKNNSSDDLLKLFRQNITSEHFEDEHSTALEFNSHQLAKIAAACLALRAYLAKIKFAQFQQPIFNNQFSITVCSP